MDTPERSPGFVGWADQYDAWQRETIRRHGWALQAVLGDEDAPPYVYTVGLSGFGHPELILFASLGADSSTLRPAERRPSASEGERYATAQTAAARLLNELGELVRRGVRLSAGERVGVPTADVHLLTFPEAEHWLFAAEDRYRQPGGPPVPALLVVPVDELESAPGEQVRSDCCAHPSRPADT